MRFLLWLALVSPLGCGFEEVVDPVRSGEAPYVPPPETCDALDLDDPEAFPHCSLGSGVFGTWIVDERGLPAYFYGLDEHADDRALFFNTEGVERRDHWFALGNHRLNVMFSNDGFVEVATQDRGVTYLNKIDPEQDAYGGGFGYIDDGAAPWSAAHRLRPEGSSVSRRFGMGYAETSTSHRGPCGHRRDRLRGDVRRVSRRVELTAVQGARGEASPFASMGAETTSRWRWPAGTRIPDENV